MELVQTPALTQLPFAVAAKAWLETRRAYISAKTFHEYTLNINTLSLFFGEMRLSEVSADQVRAYQRMRMTQCGPFGINHECGVLCQIRKRIGMPLDDYQPLPLPKEKRGRALRDEQKEKLFQVSQSSPYWQAAYLAAMISVNTTAGPKETMTLRFKDIDLERRIINIQPEGAKNVHRARPIPLNEDAFKAVESAIARAKGFGAAAPEHFLFPYLDKRTQEHDPARHQTTFKTAWLKIRVAAGLPGLRLYDLRHHAITALLEDPTVSEETAETIAGHISREMKKRYSHVRIEKMQAAVDALIKKKPPKAERSTRRAKPVKNNDELLREVLAGLAKLLKTG